jgi:hypothetical protein
MISTGACLVGFIAIIGLAAVVKANIDFSLARARLSPEQRKKHDEEMRLDGQTWQP